MTLPAAVLLGAIVSRPTPSPPRPCSRASRRAPTLAIVKANRSSTTQPPSFVRCRVLGRERGPFLRREIGLELFLAIFLSPLVGAAFAVAAALAWRRIRTPHLQTAISIILPWVAYLAADYVHASGVVAVVTAGFS